MAKVKQIFPSLWTSLQAIGMSLELKDVAKSSVESGKSKILVADWRKIPDLAYKLESTAEDFEINHLDWGRCFNCGGYIKLNRYLSGPGEGQQTFLYFGFGNYVCKHCVEKSPYGYFTIPVFEEAYVNKPYNWLPNWTYPYMANWFALNLRIVVKQKDHNSKLFSALDEARKNPNAKKLLVLLEYKSPNSSRFSIWRSYDTNEIPL